MSVWIAVSLPTLQSPFGLGCPPAKTDYILVSLRATATDATSMGRFVCGSIESKMATVLEKRPFIKTTLSPISIQHLTDSGFGISENN